VGRDGRKHQVRVFCVNGKERGVACKYGLHVAGARSHLATYLVCLGLQCTTC